jgi:hypothetical protein
MNKAADKMLQAGQMQLSNIGGGPRVASALDTLSSMYSLQGSF